MGLASSFPVCPLCEHSLVSVCVEGSDVAGEIKELRFEVTLDSAGVPDHVECSPETPSEATLWNLMPQKEHWLDEVLNYALAGLDVVCTNCLTFFDLEPNIWDESVSSTVVAVERHVLTEPVEAVPSEFPLVIVDAAERNYRTMLMQNTEYTDSLTTKKSLLSDRRLHDGLPCGAEIGMIDVLGDFAIAALCGFALFSIVYGLIVIWKWPHIIDR